MQLANSSESGQSRGVTRKKSILAVGIVLFVCAIGLISFFVFLNTTGQKLSSLLEKGDFAEAAALLHENKNGMGVSRVLDAFAQTYVTDACSDPFDEAIFFTKYNGIDVLQSALAQRITEGAGHCIADYGAEAITEERCRQNINRIDSFHMLDGAKAGLLAETEAIAASKSAFREGNECLQNEDYKNAAIAFSKVIAKDRANWVKIAGLRQQCKDAYFEPELARTKDLFDKGHYIAAFHALAQLNELFPDEDAVAALLPLYEQKKNEVRLAEVSTSSVEHIFTHCLVAYPELSISKPGGGTYDKDCLTVTEFKRLLNQLYANNYILIDINSLYEIIDGKAVLKSTIQAPEGKKPLIFSFDDVVYDPKKSGNGMVDKLVVRNGRVQTYTKMPDGTGVYAVDNEFIPIMDDFVDAHPDFSFNGAKGTICLTGFTGILGYRTDAGSPNREAEIAAVRPVVNRLKATGWNFANHGYGHYNMPTVSDALFFSDIQKWHDEVEPLVGKTYVYVYAFGAWTEYDTAKHQKLMESGYRVFCGVGANRYFINGFPKKGANTGTIFMDRRPIDGFDLRERYANYLPLMDTYAVYDHEARYIKFPKPGTAEG